MSVERDQSAGYTTYAPNPPSSEDLEDGPSADRLLDKAYEKKVLKKVLKKNRTFLKQNLLKGLILIRK